MFGSEEEMREYLSVLFGLLERGMWMSEALGIVGNGGGGGTVDRREHCWKCKKRHWEFGLDAG